MFKLINRIKYKFKSTLRNKLIIIFMCVTIIPLALLTSITYNMGSSELQKNYVNSNTSILNQLSRRLDDYFQRINDISISVISDDTLSNVSQSDETNSTVHDNKLKSLATILYQRKETNSVFLYYPLNKELFTVNSSRIAYFKDATIENTDWYQNVIKSKMEYIILPNHILSGYKSEYNLDSNSSVFSFVRYYKSSLNSKIYGVLCLNYNLTQINQMCKEVSQDENQSIIYFDKNGSQFYNSNVIKSSESTLSIFNKIAMKKNSNGSFKENYENKKYLIVYSKSAYNGSTLCKLTPLDIVYKQALSSKNINLVISFIIIIILIGTTIVISYKITKPLSNLKKSMEIAGGGNFKSHITVNSFDEIGNISNEFNKMMREINKLINEKYKMQLLYKDAQLKTLEAQINPHFLYNTLQAIGSVAIMKGVDEINTMTIALSNMLRYSIKSGGDMVSIEQEIRSIQDYLQLQKFRYEEKLNFTISMEPKLNKITIPKLVLQPFVENAIIHGIEPKKTPGLISIICKESNETLIIIIKDDGVGMNTSKLNMIRLQLKQPNDEQFDESKSMGILNVFYRLRLKMVGKCKIFIDSELGKGTSIEIHIHLSYQK